MSEVHLSIAQAVKDVFEPLCEETERMLRPLHIYPTDRLGISLGKGATTFVVEVWGVREWDPNWKAMASGNARAFSQRVPECKPINQAHTQWSMAATDITAILINSLWPAEQLVFTEPEARMLYDSLLLRWLHQSLASKQRAEYKINKLVPPTPEFFIEHYDEACHLNPYQHVGLATSVGYDAIGFFMEQGTGKTPLTIYKIMAEAAEKRKRDGGMSCYNVLVVAPKNVRMNWQREVHRFATLPGRVTVLRGGGLTRIKLLCRAMADDPEQDALFSIVICSYEAVRNSWDALSMIPWDLTVADESHYIKSPNSKRSHTMLRLRDISRRRAELTGTPITNSLMDLFMQLEFLGEGYSGFSNYKAFRKFYGKFQTNEYTKRDKLVGYQNIPFIQERLARLSFMITKKEALPFLPEKVHDITEITMTAEQLEVYEQLQAQLAVEIKDKLDNSDNDLITVNNALTMLLRLAQITSGYMALDGKVDPETGTTLKEAGKVRFFATNPKLDQLVEDLRAESDTTKTIVWTVFVPTIRQISERLTREGIKHVVYFGGTSDEDREAAEVAFNNDDSVRVFIGNPAAGGCGLNLWGYNPADLVASCSLEQDDAEDWCENAHGCSYLEYFGEPYAKPQPRSAMNCDHVIRYSSNWSMVQRVQSEDRCHRIGTRKVVRYTDYIVPNSIDEEILNRVQGYKLTAETIQDVRDIMERVLGAVINEDAGSVDLLDLAEQEDADLDTEEAA